MVDSTIQNQNQNPKHGISDKALENLTAIEDEIEQSGEDRGSVYKVTGIQ